MGVFKDGDEATKYIAGIFEEAVADESIADQLAASGVVLRLNCTDPDIQITVDMPNKKVITGSCDLSPTVAMSMTSDMANRFWQGKLNLAVSLAKGQVRAKGPVPKILKLVPVAKKLFPRYEESLRAGGRTDLLAV
ncbi:SCP2 sterol-binding domain-containing protein [Candidatus Mycolicibacterium alkanivorans]|uniref:SCP2 sterol-binding domain-containing protein n=1 Tax=Candidatus Mycolicibacterium alkanivorans TaxID=2954114 RepID=A0ABS9YZ35_9MYCO|nr:SCP2 sterol-binding domain-containing protein [Candidatus Mycolicibacterium alkanivorans]MCI4676470.1 SCP2 sterol-binding domain-containing protein [Candidatus Mycolicibacterium alkanivorans]